MTVVEVERPEPNQLDVVLTATQPMVSSVWTLTLRDPSDFDLFLSAIDSGRSLTVTVEAGT